MKIICDNCGAKYSIADEKVKGKVFKIRCKKCQESIVVRGDTQEPAGATDPSSESGGGDVETKVFDYSGYKGNEPVWYVAVEGGEQQGPYTTDQMKEYLKSGNITTETYVWREGLEDWKLAGEVKEISGAGDDANAGAAMSGAAMAGAAVESDGGLFGSADTSGGGLFDSPHASESNAGLFDSPVVDDSAGGGLFGGHAESPGDVFSSAPDMSTGGMFSADQNAAATSKDGGGLFDGPVATGSGGDLFASTDAEDGGGIFASTEAQTSGPRVSAAQAMTGQRNENSVLFSLSNLQALASDSMDAPSSDDGGAVSPFGGGMAAAPAGEASGLIDIRAMASSLTAEAEKADDVDEMLSFGGGGFASTLGAPVLTAAKPAGMSLGLKIGGAAGIVVLLIGIVIAAVMILQKDNTSAQDEKIAMLMKQIEAMKSQGASAEDILKARAELEKTKEEKKAIQTGDAVAENAQKGGNARDKASQDDDNDESASSSRSKKKSVASASSGSAGSGSSSKKESSSGGSSASSSSSAESASAAPARRKTSALDDLLGGGGGAKKKPAASSAAGGGGAKLTRQQVMSGMNAVAGSVKRCGAGKSGTFKIRAKIEPNGRVSQTQAVGQFAATPAGTCAANAVKRARFPQSSSATNVTYPFKI